MNKDLTHIDLGDGSVGAKGEVDDGLGIWDLETYGATAGCRRCEERRRDCRVIPRWGDADGEHGNRCDA